MARSSVDVIVGKYRREAHATRAVIDYYRARSRNPREGVARLADVQRELMRSGISHTLVELIEVFADFENAKWGALIRGKEKRFQWSESAREMAGNIAASAGADVFNVPHSEPVSELRHSYHLRPDYQFNFRLPSDFTELEAKRLGEFIGTLPFQRLDSAD